MIYRTRKIVKYEDLNPRGTLFGGQLLKWIDEEASVYAICQIGDRMVVTKAMSKIDFRTSPKLGDIVEIGMDLVRLGNTSITFKCNVRKSNRTPDEAKMVMRSVPYIPTLMNENKVLNKVWDDFKKSFVY